MPPFSVAATLYWRSQKRGGKCGDWKAGGSYSLTASPYAAAEVPASVHSNRFPLLAPSSVLGEPGGTPFPPSSFLFARG